MVFIEVNYLTVTCDCSCLVFSAFSRTMCYKTHYIHRSTSVDLTGIDDPLLNECSFHLGQLASQFYSSLFESYLSHIQVSFSLILFKFYSSLICLSYLVLFKSYLVVLFSPIQISVWLPCRKRRSIPSWAFISPKSVCVTVIACSYVVISSSYSTFSRHTHIRTSHTQRWWRRQLRWMGEWVTVFSCVLAKFM